MLPRRPTEREPIVVVFPCATGVLAPVVRVVLCPGVLWPFAVADPCPGVFRAWLEPLLSDDFLLGVRDGVVEFVESIALGILGWFDAFELDGSLAVALFRREGVVADDLGGIAVGVYVSVYIYT